MRSVLPGGGPPWTAERVLQAHRFGVGDRGGVEQGEILVNTVKNAAGDPDDFEDAIADKVMFDAKDNASDETLCTQTAKAVFKNMIDFGDTTHTMQLIIKHATEGEPEVKLVEGVLLTNKKKSPTRVSADCCEIRVLPALPLWRSRKIRPKLSSSICPGLLKGCRAVISHTDARACDQEPCLLSSRTERSMAAILTIRRPLFTI